MDNPITRRLNQLDRDILSLFYLVNELEDAIEDACHSKQVDTELLKRAFYVRDWLNDILVRLYGNEPLEDFYSLGKEFWGAD